MIEFLGRLFAAFLGNAGTSPTSMVAMNTDSDADLDYNKPEIWQARLRLDAARKSFFGPMKGAELSGQPIVEKSDFVNQAGDVIHVQVMSELYGPGVTGESELRGNEDKMSTGQFNVIVDWLRYAIAFTKKVKKQVNFEMAAQARTLISNWLGRKLDSVAFSTLLTGASNTLYAGNGTSEATLSDDDTFTTQELDKIKLGLDRIGAMPISIEGSNGQETYHYGVVISEVDEYNLRGDSKWLEAVQYAHIRSEKNPIFTGRPVEWNGLLVYTLRGVKAANCVQGSPLRPETTVYGSLAATGDVTVGGAAAASAGQQKQYTLFFASSGTIKIDSEEISYTSKTYRTFAGCTRGANNTTAATHSSGALITQRDVSSVIAFGSEIMALTWGQKPERVEDKDDYGFITGLGIETLYGFKAIVDSAGNTPNYLVMKAYSKNPGSV